MLRDVPVWSLALVLLIVLIFRLVLRVTFLVAIIFLKDAFAVVLASLDFGVVRTQRQLTIGVASRVLSRLVGLKIDVANRSMVFFLFR